MIDFRPALFVIGILLTTLSVAMLAPFAVDIVDGKVTHHTDNVDYGATEAELAASTGHSIERGGQILDIYNPRSFEMAKAAQTKRGNKMRAKV